MTPPLRSSSSRRRHSLAVTSALLVVWSVSGNAFAGNPLPTGGTATVGSPTIADDGTNMTVDLNNSSTVIEWTSFDIGATNSVTYNGSGKAVLNRVTGGTFSDIQGALNANGVQFWLLNPNGILVNNGASINTGSFFASTLAMTDTDFTNGGSFSLVGTNSNAIGVNSGTSIVTSGGPLVLAAQNIHVGGSLSAGSGKDVALVAATDLTIAAAPFSPLSITVNAGTTVATAKVQVDGTGQISGKSIIVAGKVDSSSPALLDDLLNIDSGAQLTASGSGGRIILSAGGVDVSAGSSAGITGLTGGGSAGVDSAATLQAASDVIIAATGNLTQAGDVTAGGDYQATGDDSVFLAGTQSAQDQVSIQGTDVTATGTLALTSNSGDAHAAGSPLGDMTVTATTGDINLGSTSTLKGGNTHHTDVVLTSGAGGDVTVGNVTAQSLGGLSGQTGNISVGTVSVDQALNLETTGGDVTAKGVTTGGTGQDATIVASGTATVDGAVSVSGDYTVTGNAVAIGGAQGARNTVAVTATGGDITATATALTLTSNKDDSHAAGSASGAMTLTAASGKVDLGSGSTLNGGNTHHTEITVTSGAGKDVVLGAVTAQSLSGLSAQTANITTGNISVDQTLDLETTGGDVTTGALTVTGTNHDAVISASGTATVDGAVSVTGDYSVTGNDVALGGVQGAHGKITVLATGGDITATATPLSLTSNKDDAFAAGNAGGAMSLTASSGNVDLGSTSTLNGGNTHHTDITVTTGANKDAVLGTVTARSLAGLASQTGDITVGNVNVDTALDLETSNGSVTTKALTVGGTGQNATLSASATATVDGAVSVTGDYSVTGNAVALGGAQGAHGKITVLATGGDITATATPVTLTSNKDDAFAAGNAGGAMGLTATSGKVDLGTTSTLKGGGTSRLSDITITTGAGKLVKVGTVATRSLSGLGAQTGDITTGDVTVDQAMTLKTTAGNVTTGAVTVGGSNQALDIEASGDVTAAVQSSTGNATLKGSNIHVTSVTSSAGDVDVEATSDLTGAATVPSPASLSDYGRSDLTAQAAGKKVTAKATGGTAKLGTVSAGDGTAPATTTQVDIAGAAVDVTSADARDAKLSVQATAGDAVIGTASARADIQVLASANIRTGTATSTAGSIAFTATTGDISGLAISPSATDFRLLAGFGRAGLTAAGQGQTVTVTATQGNIQAGAVTAGAGTLSPPATTNEITLTAGKAMDISSANARDGKLTATAQDGDLVMVTPTGAGGVSLEADKGATTTTASIRSDTVSSAKGDVALTADNGNITATAATSGGTDYQKMDVTAGGADRTIVVSADHGTVLFDTVAAGTGGTTLAGNQVSVSAHDIVITDVTATNGGILLSTAVAGGGNDISVGSAHAKASVTLNADGNAAATTLTGDTADVVVSASNDATIDGNVSAGANYLVSGRSVTLGKTSGTVTQTAGGLVRVASTAGDISGLGTLVLKSDADGTGEEPILLDATGGNIGFATGTTLQGGANRTGKIGIRLGTAGSDLSLGTVNARGLYGLDGGEAFLSALTTSGDVTLGATSLRNALTLETTNGDIHAGAITTSGAGQGLSLKASGDIVAGGNLSSQGNLRLEGADIGITSAQSHTGTATLMASGTATGTSLKALGSVSETAATDQITTSVAGAASAASADSPTDPGAHANSGAGAGGTGLGIGYDAPTPAGSATADPALTDVTLTGAVIDKTTVTATRDVIVTAGDSGTATNGSVNIDTVTAGRDATLTVWAGGGATAPADGTVSVDTVTAGRDLTLTTSGGAGGGITVATLAKGSDGGAQTGNVMLTSAGTVRATEVKTDKGNVDITATGDISGTKAVATPASISDYNRATVTAGGQDATGRIQSTTGRVRLGAVTAGAGTTTYGGGTQLWVQGADVDAGSVTATNGSVMLTAFDPAYELVVTTITAKTDVDVTAADAVRVGSVTASTGHIAVLATNGEVSGLKRTTAAGDGRLLAGYDRADFTAGDSVTVHADGASGNLQFGTATAGTGVTGTARAIDGDDANGGSLALTSSQGDVRLIQGHALDAATISAAANARVGALDTTHSDATITATSGAVTGLSGAGEASNLDAAYGRTVISAGNDIAVTSHGLAQLGALTAGRDIAAAAGANAQVDGAVQAGRTYDVAGSSVFLGHAAATQAQWANGLVRITAGSGDITSRGAITLTANKDDTAATAEPMFLKATGGSVDFSSGTLLGGTNRSSNIGILLGTPGADMNLGTVQARGLYGLDAGETLLATLATSGDVRLGATSLRNSLDILTTGGDIVTTGDVSVTGAGQGLTFDTSGAAGHDITAGGVLSAQGDLALASARDITLTTAVSNAGNATLSAGRNASGTRLQAFGDIGESATGSDTITETKTASGLSSADSDAFAIAPGGVTGDPAVAAASAVGAGDVTISAGTVTKETGIARRDLSATASTGDVTIGMATAGRDLNVKATQANVRLDAGEAMVGQATVTAALAATGRAGASDGKDAAVQRMNLAAGTGITVTSGTLSQLGTVVADTDAIGVTAGNSATAHNGAIDIASADAGTNLSLKTWSNDPTVAGGNGDILVGSAIAGSGATLDNSTGTVGNIVIANGLTASNNAAGDAVLKAAGAIRVDAVTAKAGSVAMTAGSDISGVQRTTAASDGRQLAGYDRGSITAGGSTGSVAVTAANGKIQLGAATAAGSVTASARGIDVTSATASGGALKLTAAAGDIALHDGTAQGDAEATASASVRVGSVTSKTGKLTLTATQGDVTGLASTAAPAGLADYGRADLAAQANGKSVAVSAGHGAAKLGTVSAGDGSAASAGDQITVAAKGVDITTVAARDGDTTLTASTDNVVLDSAKARGNVTVTAAGGVTGSLIQSTDKAIAVEATSGDIALGTGSAGTSATLKAGGNTRLGTVSANAGTVGVTAGGDISGLARTGAASDGRLLAGYDRADISAAGDGQSINLTGRSVQAGTVSAGMTTTAVGGTQLAIAAGAIDVTTATARNGALDLSASTGDLKLGTGTATGNATLKTTSAGADIAVGTALTGASVAITSADDANLSAVTSKAGDISVSAATIEVGSASANTALSLTSSGNLALGGGSAGTTALLKTTGTGDATLTGSLTSVGKTTIASASGATLGDITAAGADITAVKTAKLGTVTGKTGDVAVSAATIEVVSVSATSALSLTSTGNLSLGGGSAGTTALLKTTGTGNVVLSSSLTSGGKTTIASASNATLGDITAGGADITAAKAARLGAVTATGKDVSLHALDADLTGDIKASTISVTADQALALGDLSGGFNLSSAELNHLKTSGGANTVTLSAGSFGIAIGNVDWTLSDAATTANLFTTGRVDVTGRFALDPSASGSTSTTSRTVVIGGTTTAGSMASVIRVAATPDKGGRIDVGAGTVDLRGASVGVGEDEAFLSSLGIVSGPAPLAPDVVAGSYVSQPESTLYRARLIYSDPVLIRAGALKVEYSNFALFQNTGLIGQNGGVLLSGGLPTVVLNSGGTANAFAMFGEINQIGGQAAALLGPTVIAVNGAAPGSSRINGCVIGAATACLASSITQPTVNVFDSSKVAVLSTVSPDLSFDTGISSSNESLFSDIAAPATQDTCDPTAPNCPSKENKQ